MDPDPHGSGTLPGSGIKVPDPDPKKVKELIIIMGILDCCTIGQY